MSCPPPRHNFASLPRATWRSRPGLGPGQTLRVEKRLHRDRADGLAIHLAEHCLAASSYLAFAARLGTWSNVTGGEAASPGPSRWACLSPGGALVELSGGADPAVSGAARRPASVEGGSERRPASPVMAEGLAGAAEQTRRAEHLAVADVPPGGLDGPLVGVRAGWRGQVDPVAAPGAGEGDGVVGEGGHIDLRGVMGVWMET